MKLLLRMFSLRRRSLGSFLLHGSILFIVFGAAISGLYGQRGFLTIYRNESVDTFISKHKPVNLGFSLRLDDFIYTEAIDAKEKLLVYPAEKDKFCGFRQVSAVKQSAVPIAQIPAETGRQWDVAGTGYKVKIIRYFPDFVMDVTTKEITSRSAKANNPAIEVELVDKDGKSENLWVFARHPDTHQKIAAGLKFAYRWAMRRPQDFVSKVTIIKEGRELMRKEIRVNQPLRFGGYSFFQSSYDDGGLNWSGLRVAKDPAVWVVYSGFILLIAGLVFTLYVNPLMIRR